MTPLDDLDVELPTRAALRLTDARTVEQLLWYSAGDLMDITGDPGAVWDVIQALRRRGLELSGRERAVVLDERDVGGFREQYVMYVEPRFRGPAWTVPSWGIDCARPAQVRSRVLARTLRDRFRVALELDDVQ